jgi:hypothetical protein
VTTDSLIDDPRIRVLHGVAGAAPAPGDQRNRTGAPEAIASPDHRGRPAGPSWESECACPELCLRDHERD